MFFNFFYCFWNKTGETLKVENFGNFCLNITLQYYNSLIMSVDVVQSVVMCQYWWSE